MNKPWLGYVSSALFLIAGIFMIADERWYVGSLLILVSAASTVLNFKMNVAAKRNKPEK
ncbi:MAG: hypothetical protein HYX39_10305 [Bacteroidetes bacterium]|nr:hypothetical protein [Bacteroidota bacterium]